MATNVALDQIDTIALQAVDAQKVVIAVTYDSPPVWTDSTPATATLVPSADGTSAVLTPVAVGTTTVGVTAIVGGKTFTFSADYAVTDVIAGVQFQDTLSPKP